MRGRGASRLRFPADRRVAVTVRFPVYRQVGRRPSQVYVDQTMTPAASGSPERRLSDSVFWRTFAEIGDQIEERAGGMLLLTEAMASHPIQLSVPRPLEVATAFGHADAVLHEDRKILDDLLAAGSVIEVPARRLKIISSQSPDTVLAENHPLVVTARPHGLDEDQPALPAASAEHPPAAC